jgi:hypothetical protein
MRQAVAAALANAYRQVNVSFSRLPKSKQDAIPIGYDQLDRELEASIASGEADRAMAAIADWRAHWLRKIERGVSA